MYVGLVKLKEDNQYVWYRFDTNISDGIYIDDRGRERGLTKTIYGYCMFNKENEEFKLDTEKTDSFFLRNKSREVLHAQVKLIKIKRAQEAFPSTTSIQTG